MTNPARMDLASYINHDIIRIAEMETESLKRYNEVTGENYTSDSVLAEALQKDIIPVYRRFLELLRSIDPQTEDVKNLHKIYIDGAEYTYRGLEEILGGVKLKDIDMIRAGNKKIEKGRVENEKWREKLIMLYNKYDIPSKPFQP